MKIAILINKNLFWLFLEERLIWLIRHWRRRRNLVSRQPHWNPFYGCSLKAPSHSSPSPPSDRKKHSPAIEYKHIKDVFQFKHSIWWQTVSLHSCDSGEFYLFSIYVHCRVLCRRALSLSGRKFSRGKNLIVLALANRIETLAVLAIYHYCIKLMENIVRPCSLYRINAIYV